MTEQTVRLNEVFSRHYHDLIAWCRVHVRQDLGDPEDFVHLAYLRCSRSWRPERSSKSSNQAAYLFRALRWVVLDALRQHLRQRTRRWELPKRENDPPGVALRQAVAREAVMCLPCRQSQVCLAILAGKTTSEICYELKITPGALAVHVCRARASLCKLLEVSRD